jgi:hypothetical protein
MMQDLFRKAVKALRGDACLKCIEEGETKKYPVEIHHIVMRGFKLLRYNPENGIPLCGMNNHHQWADTGAGREWCRNQVDKDYLDTMQAFGTMKNYLQERGISESEWLVEMKDRLLTIIKENER